MTTSKRSRKAGARRQCKAASFATSCKAVGWASMLFSVSSVSAFSSVGQRPGVRSEFQVPGLFSDSKNFALRRKDSITSLHALGDSDQQAAPRHPKRDAPMRHPSPRRFDTRLNYRDGAEHEPQVRQKEQAIEELQDQEAAKWWRSVFQPAPAPSHEDEQQQVVDEYLEFLDKRYKRLHEKEKKKPEPAANKFSALSWLTADKSDPISQQQEEDALYVLGVAELASERLLQKHHASLQQYKRKVPAQETKKEDEVVIDAESHPVDDNVVLDESSKVRKALAFATLAEAGRKVLRSVSDRRKALIAYQEKKVVSALLLTCKTTLGAPVKAAKLLWNVGGGKKTIALTLSAFITVFLVVRPVAQAVMSEATSYSQ